MKIQYLFDQKTVITDNYDICITCGNFKIIPQWYKDFNSNENENISYYIDIEKMTFCVFNCNDTLVLNFEFEYFYYDNDTRGFYFVKEISKLYFSLFE